jgi:hypothetical protein
MDPKRNKPPDRESPYAKPPSKKSKDNDDDSSHHEKDSVKKQLYLGDVLDDYASASEEDFDGLEATDNLEKSFAQLDPPSYQASDEDSGDIESKLARCRRKKKEFKSFQESDDESSESAEATKPAAKENATKKREFKAFEESDDESLESEEAKPAAKENAAKNASSCHSPVHRKYGRC